jgi:hypothetical protein
MCGDSVIWISRLLPILVRGHERVLEWVPQSNRRGDINEPDKTGQKVITWEINLTNEKMI